MGTHPTPTGSLSVPPMTLMRSLSLTSLMLSIPCSFGWYTCSTGWHTRRISVRRAMLYASEPGPIALSAEETAALMEASSSTAKAWTGENCPPELRNIMSMPDKFYCLLRNPKIPEIDPIVWDAVREQWPILKDTTDAQLQEAIGPIR